MHSPAPGLGRRPRPERAFPRVRAARQPLSRGRRRRGAGDRRCRMGARRSLLRHCPALRTRPVRTPARPRAGVASPRRLRAVVEGRAVARAGRRSSRDWTTTVTSCPATHRRVWDFSRDGIRRSLEESLRRLGLDRVDIAYLHDPDDHIDDVARARGYPGARQSSEREGSVAAIGAGMNDASLLARLVRETDMDVVMLAGRYTLLEQDSLDDLLPLCVERGVGVVAAGVFNSGLLARPQPSREAKYDYETAPRELVDRARAIAAVCDRHGTSLPAAAIAFPLAHPAVVSVCLGARSAKQVQQNVALYGEPIAADLWSELKASGSFELTRRCPRDPHVRGRGRRRAALAPGRRAGLGSQPRRARLGRHPRRAGSPLARVGLPDDVRRRTRHVGAALPAPGAAGSSPFRTASQRCPRPARSDRCSRFTTAAGRISASTTARPIRPDGPGPARWPTRSSRARGVFTVWIRDRLRRR